MKPEFRDQFSSGSFFRVNYFELLWKIQAQGVIATLLGLPVWEYM